MDANPPPAASIPGAEPPGGGLVVRRRQCRVPLEMEAATQERLAAYLAQVDRPLAALLARDRLERLGEGHYRYRSRPFRVLRFEVVPTLDLWARWQPPRLTVLSGDCRIHGLGRWERSLAFQLAAELAPAPGALEGELRASLGTAGSLPGWGRQLAGAALDQVVERIERRLRRGLRKDLLTWLLDHGVSG